MPNVWTLCAVLLTTLLGACNQYSNAPETPTQWQFESYTCAFGCDPMLDEILNRRIGEILNFNTPQNGFNLFSECKGTLTLQENTQTTEDVLNQLNQTHDPSQKFTAKNVGLDQPLLTTAQAICHESGKSSTTFWVVLLNEKQMKVYFEGASFLNFKAVKKD